MDIRIGGMMKKVYIISSFRRKVRHSQRGSYQRTIFHDPYPRASSRRRRRD